MRIIVFDAFRIWIDNAIHKVVNPVNAIRGGENSSFHTKTPY